MSTLKMQAGVTASVNLHLIAAMTFDAGLWYPVLGSDGHCIKIHTGFETPYEARAHANELLIQLGEMIDRRLAYYGHGEEERPQLSKSAKRK